MFSVTSVQKGGLKPKKDKIKGRNMYFLNVKEGYVMTPVKQFH